MQTYAWLRTRQPNSLPVAAGVLLYINELAPVRGDLVELKDAMASGSADVVPAGGSLDAYQLSAWRPGNAIPQFSLAFRLARAIRVIPVSAVARLLLQPSSTALYQVSSYVSLRRRRQARSCNTGRQGVMARAVRPATSVTSVPAPIHTTRST